jgi:hypothetical protein
MSNNFDLDAIEAELNNNNHQLKPNNLTQSSADFKIGPSVIKDSKMEAVR